jgi:hypothetical protein
MGTLVVGDVLNAARDCSPQFDTRRHPDRVLLRFLSRYQRDLVDRLVRLDPSQLVMTEDYSLPLPSFDAGIAIPAYHYPFGAEVLSAHPGAHPVPIPLVNWADHARNRHAVYLLSGVLFLCGKVHDWERFVTLRWIYVPEVADLDTSSQGAMTQVLTALPDSAEPPLVAFLAMRMAMRGGVDSGQTPADPASLGGDWKFEENRFFDAIGRNTQAVSSVMREVLG